MIFEYDAQIYSCCHVGGGMGFDSKGNLYVTTGDTNSSQGTDGYSGNNPVGQVPDRPTTRCRRALHCGTATTPTRTRAAPRATPTTTTARCCGSSRSRRSRTARSRRSASAPPTRSRAPTRPNGPNLFKGDEGNGNQAKPEIYAMGLRNPSRLSIDPKTDMPYTAWVGPDAGAPSATLGPSTYENAAQITRAGNYGWPYCMGYKQAYRDRIGRRQRCAPTTPAGYVPGGPATGGTDGWYDCDNLRQRLARTTPA